MAPLCWHQYVHVLAGTYGGIGKFIYQPEKCKRVGGSIYGGIDKFMYQSEKCKHVGGSIYGGISKFMFWLAPMVALVTSYISQMTYTSLESGLYGGIGKFMYQAEEYKSGAGVKYSFICIVIFGL